MGGVLKRIPRPNFLVSWLVGHGKRYQNQKGKKEQIAPFVVGSGALCTYKGL